MCVYCICALVILISITNTDKNIAMKSKQFYIFYKKRLLHFPFQFETHWSLLLPIYNVYCNASVSVSVKEKFRASEYYTYKYYIHLPH